jgi:hypothetical protein
MVTSRIYGYSLLYFSLTLNFRPGVQRSSEVAEPWPEESQKERKKKIERERERESERVGGGGGKLERNQRVSMFTSLNKMARRHAGESVLLFCIALVDS